MGRNGSTKLNSMLVQEIRRKYDVDGRSQGSLAREYEMSIGQIGRVVRRESWGGVKPGLSAEDLEAAAQRVAAVQRLVDEVGPIRAPGDMPVVAPTPMVIAPKVLARASLLSGKEIKAPKSPLEGGEASDEAGGAGLQRLGEEIATSPIHLINEMKEAKE